MIVFKGSGGVRAGWRFAGFFILSFGLVFFVAPYVALPIANLLRVDVNSLNAYGMLLEEIVTLAAVIVATAIFARLERRRVDSYGLPLSSAFGGNYWEGVAIGVVAVGAVALAMLAAGGFVVHGFALSGMQWLAEPLLWALCMVVVGPTEEYWFRGYLLQSLARGTGFWPAAVVTTLIFGGTHVLKPDENFVDIFNVMALGLLTCLMLRRTGSLWMAVGFHTAFDFMQFFVIGTRNGGQTPIGTLFHASFPGPAWVNGGALGTEASWFMFPVMLAILIYVLLRYPQARELQVS